MPFSSNSKAVPENSHHIIERSAAVLLDWDGCIALSNQLLPGAVRFLRKFQDRIAIVSNNSTEMPAHFAAMLNAQGCDIMPRRILLAGHETVVEAAHGGARRILLLGNPAMHRHASDMGLKPVENDPEMVLLMRDTCFSYDRLQRALHAVQDGAPMLVANCDRTHPGLSGRPVPETGALLAALQACDPDLSFRIVGKPSPHLYRRACHELGVAMERAVMIGDNPETDMAGAQRLGMAALLLGPGGHLPVLDVRAPAQHRRAVAPLIRSV
ncbi:MAG: HAD-IIA family hydrolase [Sphingopyxis sp.]|uniref:HAD-IIA family hydrolase n=1 Tax=Sphingopyxis sp. TaxID=1908224 RepID=UPI002ABA09B3|nr:HAD-IIA family hydrolase [Sphingopyxis sp.]MDZ3832199.1 HAD-IIA family hydrolase [Sphingopyxis sp.]